MNFRTDFKIKAANKKITHQSSIVLIGSCFSDNIGSIFADYKFEVATNPFGISYNPISIAHQLDRIILNKTFETSDLFEDQGIHKSFELHSSRSSQDPNKLLSQLNRELKDSNLILKNASHVFITFGTAWIYFLKRTGDIVNNCHKLNASNFNKEVLTVDLIIEKFKETIALLKKLNPEVEIIFNLSPVRHIKDGIENNSLSKAILRMAIDEIIKFSDSSYFPSNEILLDDLRDYRFYEADLIHPNKTAIEYIWEKLCGVYMENETLELINQIASINQAVKHRSFQPNSTGHKAFLTKTLKKIELIQQRHFMLNFEKEITDLKGKLSE